MNRMVESRVISKANIILIALVMGFLVASFIKQSVNKHVQQESSDLNLVHKEYGMDKMLDSNNIHGSGNHYLTISLKQ